MPRKQRSHSNDSAQLSVRCDAELKERYKEALDGPMSDDLRRHMIEVVGESDDVRNPWLPDDERLRDAYWRLYDEAREPTPGAGLRVRLETAENVLYSSETPKDAVRADLLEPLRRLDLLRVDRGAKVVWLVLGPFRDSEGSA